MYSQEFLGQIKQKLLEEKAKLETEIANLTRPEDSMDNPSPEDLADDATEDLMEESLLKVYRASLVRIDEALGRLGNSTFGRCINCGAVIKEENLMKEPWVEYCEQCNLKK